MSVHAPARPGLAQIGQIAIAMKDLPRAVAFYRDVLGLPFLFEAPPKLAFFDCAGVRLMLSEPEKPEFDHPASTYARHNPGAKSPHAPTSSLRTRTSLRTIHLVYFNAGGGHRSAAIALDAVIREQGRPWQVRLINLMEVLDPKDVFRKTMGMEWEDLYNTRLARGWSLGLAQELKFLQALIRLCHQGLTSRLRRYWRRTKPDMVVSLIPNFNRTMYEALAGARPAAPYVTILTDFADLPPHFWIEPGQAQHFVCGTRKAVAQAFATFGLGGVTAVLSRIPLHRLLTRPTQRHSARNTT